MHDAWRQTRAPRSPPRDGALPPTLCPLPAHTPCWGPWAPAASPPRPPSSARAHPRRRPIVSSTVAKIQNDLRILTERLARINDNLARKISSRNEYDKTIQETEAAYAKIMESSQTLLHVLKRESVNLTKKKQASS